MSCKATEHSVHDPGGVGVIMIMLEPEIDPVRPAARDRIKTQDRCADNENNKCPSYWAQIVTFVLHMHDENDCFTVLHHFFRRGQMTDVVRNLPRAPSPRNSMPGCKCISSEAASV